MASPPNWMPLRRRKSEETFPRKAGELKAFANQVNAQTGKALTPNQAEVLLTLVRTL